MNAMPTILIIEPNPLFRKALTNTIRSRFPELAIAECATAADAVEKSISVKPQLVLMDIHLSHDGSEGLALIRDIASRQPYTLIAVLTDSDDKEYQKAAFDNGADFFISKTEPNEGKKVLTLIRNTLMEA